MKEFKLSDLSEFLKIVVNILTILCLLGLL